MPKSIKLKDYSRSVYFPTLNELKLTLQHDYLGRHVAIHLKSKRGLTAPFFVSVKDDGEVVETYGSSRPVDWDLLEKVLN